MFYNILMEFNGKEANSCFNQCCLKLLLAIKAELLTCRDVQEVRLLLLGVNGYEQVPACSHQRVVLIQNGCAGY